MAGGLRIRRARAAEAPRLFEIWRAAVAATHAFLAPDDEAAIARLVRDDYLPAARLWVAVDGGGRVLGFLGMTGAVVDTLFVDPAVHRRGIGSALMAHAAVLADAPRVDVNEQNEAALAFYRRLGFEIVGRSPLDVQGRPYPILHLSAGKGQAAPLPPRTAPGSRPSPRPCP